MNDEAPGPASTAGPWLARAVAGGELDLPLPGRGHTLERFRRLAAVAAADVARARLAEGHADALAILVELGARPDSRQVWGVWAARPASLRARHTDGRWHLSGRREWCSGAGTCTRALVTARAGDGVRLFVLDPAAGGVRIVPDSWPAVGMANSDSRTLELNAATATAVGPAGGYSQRPGFCHGAIGVAACWYGGAVGVARVLLPWSETVTAPDHAENDPHARAHLGAVDSALHSARATLVDAAAQIDADPRVDLARLAAQVRAGVEAAAEVLTRVGRATGAGPLCRDRDHARRVADLTVYLRQSHAEQDLQCLGARALIELDRSSAWDLTPAAWPVVTTARPGSAA